MKGRAWLVLAGVATGISVQGMLDAPTVAAVSIVATPAMLARRRTLLTVASAFLLAACGGWSAATMHVSDGASLRSSALRFPRCSIEGRVLEHAGGLGTLIAIEASDCSSPGEGMAAIPPLDLASGTRFSATGRLYPLGEERLDAARARLGADARFEVQTLTPHEVEGVAHSVAGAFRAALSRSALELSPVRRGLILGMTVGDTSDIPERTIEQLRRAGLTHLLAVSGSNVAIVVGVVAASLRRLSLNARILGSALALSFYVLVVGPEPSVLRAGVMGAIALVALWRGHPTSSLQMLALALVVLLILRPSLLYSPGLHLSAAATFGIVLWAHSLSERCRRLTRPVALVLAATLAAQFAVSPVLLATFGELSLVAPLANVLAFPVVAPATVLGLAAGVVALVWPSGASALMMLISPLAGWIELVGRWTGAGGWASIQVPRRAAFPAALFVAAAAWRALHRGKTSCRPRSRDDAVMDEWRWRLHDPEGADLRQTESFASQEEAEAWMGAEWQSLLDEGAETVSLTRGGAVVYTMGLREG